MKLIYTGTFEQLKEFGFAIDCKEWFVFDDIETNAYVFVAPISKEIKWSVCITGIKEIPTIIYDLIQAGLVKKEKE